MLNTKLLNLVFNMLKYNVNFLLYTCLLTCKNLRHDKNQSHPLKCRGYTVDKAKTNNNDIATLKTLATALVR